MRTTLVYSLILATTAILAQQPNFQWAKAFQGAANDGFGGDIAVDASGNVYCAGKHTGLNFDPAGNTGGYQPSYGDYDGYITKLDNSGSYLWSGSVGGPNLDNGLSVTIDNQSNVYFSGFFTQSADLDPGSGTLTVTAIDADAYILKLNSSGNLQWAATISGAGYQYAHDMACDASNNLYVAGYFTGTADFDPGSGTYTLTSNGNVDAFLMKLSPTGAFIWARSFGSIDYDVATSVAVDINGDVYVTGSFIGTVDFDPGSSTHTISSVGGTQDFYLSKFAPNGNFVWTRSYGSAGDDWSPSVTTDVAGNIFTAARYGGTLTVGTNTVGHNASWDGFFTKHTNSGNLIWLKTINGPGHESPSSIRADASGNLYVTGFFDDVVDFDPGNSTYTLSPPPGGAKFDIFMMQLDSSGNFNWALRMGNGGTDQYGTAIALDQARNIYSTGGFYGSIDFDPGAGTYSFAVTTSTNIYPYVHKMCSPPDKPAAISGTTLVCGASSHIYSIVPIGGVTYTWTAPQAWTNTSSVNSFSAFVQSAGSISVSASNSCGTSATRTLNVQLLPTPSITINSGTICPGQSFTFTPAGASAYTITGGSAVVSPTVLTTYSVTGTNSVGCTTTAAATATVGIFPQPTITAPSGTLCSGSAFNINPSGGINYTFSSGSNLVSPTVTTSYSVSGTNSFGCPPASPAVLTVTVLSLPLPTVNVNSGSMCSGYSFTIIPSGALTYTITGGQFVVSPTVSSFYTVTGTDASGCRTAPGAIASVTVNPLPTVTIVAGTDQFCEGDLLTMTAAGAATYTWSTMQISPVVSVVAGAIVNATVTGTDLNGCTNTATIQQTSALCTGFEVKIAGEFYLFPNPCSGMLNVRSLSNTPIRRITVANVLGEILTDIQLEDNTTKVDMSQFSPAIYLVTVETSAGVRRMKVIKEL